MAARFGAVSASTNQIKKLRWIMGGLFAVLAIVGVSLLVFLNDGENPNVAVAVTSAEQPAQSTSNVEVLTASTRIEEGTRLEPHMFSTVGMDAEKTPLSVVRSKDLNSIIGMYAKRQINPSMPIVSDDISDTQPISSIKIPPGYRAVSIEVDVRALVEGFAKPNSRVDIVWTYQQEGKKKVATIVRFVKVLSVGGVTQATGERSAVKGTTTITLLVTEKDAKKIELARTLGQLSLSLLGDQEQGTEVDPDQPEEITINDLIGRSASDENSQLETDGVMYTADPRTGKQVRYVLRNGRWVRDDSFDEQE